jgi:hypothetical protein
MSAFVFIKNRLSGNVIDIQDASTKSGALLNAFSQKTSENDNQLWEFVPDAAGSGYYFIKSKLSGNVIDIEGASAKPGTPLDAFLQKATGNDNQLWEFVPDPAGSGYHFIRSKLAGNVIDIEGASAKPGARLDAFPVKTSGNENQLWQAVGGKFPPPRSLHYTFGLDWFRINNTRSGNIFSNATDTDYAGFSLTVAGKSAQTQVKSMGNLSNGTYSVDLQFPAIEVPDDSKVIVAYHIANNSQGGAPAYVQQTLEKLTTAAAQALTNEAAGDIGTAIGAAIGTAIPVPLIGTALGALAGWLVEDIWNIAFPNCDGPVAAGVHIYSGAQLRAMTLQQGAYGSLEHNPGVNSPSGCGSNSNYDVYWSVSSPI